MRIAIITGASSGIGKEFTKQLPTFNNYDEVWLIARREDRLLELQKELPYKTKVLSLDLSVDSSYQTLAQALKEASPEVALLINCSGFGKFCATESVDLSVNLNMVDLNCKGVMATCQLVLPYMAKGSKIINIASVAGFQPVPYINVYAASKAFVLYYSRGLNREVRKRGISVTAVCPFWTKTEFFDRAVKKDQDQVVKKYVAMYYPHQIVKRAFRDVKRGKDVSKFGFIARAQAGLAKILPHSLVMNVWQSQQKLK